MDKTTGMPGLELIGQGATTKIYRDGDMAVKLYTDAPYEEVEREAGLQRFAHEAGLPVPAVYGVRKLAGGAVALDMEFIDGSPLMRRGMDKSERNGAIDTLVRLQRDIHAIRACGLPKLSARLRRRIEDTRYLNDSVKEKLLPLLTGLSDDSCFLCHGDFHPLNILYDGQRHRIIDWVDAAAGDPVADACRTYLLFRQHISRLAGAYLRAFCKESGIAREKVLAWLPVVAAARLGERMDGKAIIRLVDIVTGWYDSIISEVRYD